MPSFDPAEIRDESHGGDAHTALREDSCNVGLCTGPDDHCGTKVPAECRSPLKRESSFKYAREVVARD
jgi:hypothetical protein